MCQSIAEEEEERFHTNWESTSDAEERKRCQRCWGFIGLADSNGNDRRACGANGTAL